MRQAGLWLLLSLSVGAAAPFATAHQDADGAGVDLLDGLRDGWAARWMEQRMARDSTRFSVVLEDTRRVLQADSDTAAAALWRRIDLGEPTSARLSWRWKINGGLDTQADERTRQGDDYAARVMVAFSTDVWGAETRAIAYVWARDLRVGARFPNPFRSRVATVVLRSAGDAVDRWVVDDRDLLADYQMAFGEPPDYIGGIAFMVDTDNTETRARSWLSDLRLTALPAPD